MYRKEPNTELAWNALYSKLEKDHLLDKDVARGTKHKTNIPFYWVAASVAVLFCAAFFFLNHYYSKRDVGEMLTLQNTDSDNVLVKILDDGSTIYLASDATLSYPKNFTSKEREVSLKGEALFDVARNPEKPFVIETEKVKVKVLGTAFKVNSSANGAFELSVERGKVRVTEKNGGNWLEVVAGEFVSFNGNHLMKRPIKDQNIFEHYADRMRFKDEMLENIVKVINQNNDSVVVIHGENLKRAKLNVRFYNNNINEMTNIITLALNLKRVVRQDTIHISQP
ncbi:FecR family protein [Bacteroides sedimenti]|uniref:Anti-sigma factor n=1 Tax=Bacteroides sedimenti TaxID=2136147 RepID=A0ABM8IGR6_9BACE